MTLGRFFLVIAVSALCLGCKDSLDHTAQAPAPASLSAAATAAKPAVPKKIALVMKTLTNPFFIEMEHGARRAEKEFGVELQVKTGSDETAVEQQIQIVDDLIQAHVDAIVIAPGDSQRVVPILKKAQATGIVIVNIDNQLDRDVVASQKMTPPPFVSTDNEAGAYSAAKYLAEQAKKPTQALIIEGLRSAANGQMRLAGAKRAFAENPNVHVVASESGEWKIDVAHDLAQRMFQAHPQVRMVFCSNDMMALGVVKYLQDSGRKDVLVAGYDALDEARAAIKAGTLAATIDQQAAEQGYQGVALAVRALKGESVPATVTVDSHLVTAASMGQASN
ncbi:MAG: substrate-binding domain-containing protein [Burkholderiaceae bacterium]|nr:substrate-binding domain-containing protein [Burkholderiaceae bacterium]